MEDWQQRVVDEKTELFNKLEKLIIFLNSEASDKISEQDRELLYDQREAMQSYYYALSRRIKLFK